MELFRLTFLFWRFGPGLDDWESILGLGWVDVGWDCGRNEEGWA